DSHDDAVAIAITFPVFNSDTQPIVTQIGTFGLSANDESPNTGIVFRNPETPFTLRTWSAGDRIHLGNAGTKKISDLITDWKIPLRLKSSVYVLALDETIIACIFAHSGYPARHRI